MEGLLEMAPTAAAAPAEGERLEKVPATAAMAAVAVEVGENLKLQLEQDRGRRENERFHQSSNGHAVRRRRLEIWIRARLHTRPKSRDLQRWMSTEG